ncbi:FAD-binding oxidoreductase [Marinomonas sp. A79]|uniref:FAD-binding oxidoreductase n=1 Tax=Marinomonas vulgaris TaxID=2823372 RepID=A0ABS5HGI9_9GAMM|nr:FAD-binding oxidoreductase [Marinomonas vulgaris]MBR7890034.1 FAD-binding oxidoreductase [Marinomonas vulgaris]
MTITLDRIETQDTLPTSASVVIVGGGIVGISAALALAERGISVVLLEKGHIAGEQSSRNLGWIRKTNRHLHDVPLAQAADRLWAGMADRVGQDVGYQQGGIMFLAKTTPQLDMHKGWLDSVASLSLDSKIVDADDIDTLVPGGKGKWLGGIYTPSDGYAEPALATPAIAKAAIKKGAVLIQECAVRTLLKKEGRITGVMTEKGEIQCDQVLLAGGAWSRRFLGNLNIGFPTLPLICSVLRTKPMEGPTNIAVGGPDFSFRKHKDGGYIITQRGKLDAPITLDHMLVGHRYIGQLKTQRDFLNVSLGRYFFRDLALSRRWSAKSTSPFETYRVNSPAFNAALNQQALDNLKAAWPIFEKAEIAEAWAGIIDVTPDSNPVIDHIASIPGLTIATGFSGHGFGTGPAAGQLAADLIAGVEPMIDPSPYRFDRLAKGK